MTDKKTGKRSGTPVSIRETLKKAVTELLVLLVLHERSMYTYEMMREIETRSGGEIVFNTLYQAIYRLQEFHYIVEESKKMVDNRVRIYFSITPEGETYLEQLITEYRSFTRTVDRVLEAEQAGEKQKDGEDDG